MKTPSKTTLVISRTDIHSIVKNKGLNTIMDDLIAKLTKAIHAFDAEKTEIPIRSGFNYRKPDPGLVEWMPLYNKGEDVVIKLVGYHPNNPNKYELPTIISTISAYDTSTGHLKGLTDGVLLTAFRTGAASAVCSKQLAHPDSSTLGLIGVGAQAVTQLHALSRVFNIKRVLTNDTDPDAMTSFENRCAALELDIEIIPTGLDELVAESDIICTATSIDPGAGPLFSNLETKPHVHVNAVGSDFPEKTELPQDLLLSSFVCPDFLEQAMVEGECQRLQPESIGPVLAEVVKNSDQYAHIQNQRSVFDSTGWVLEDYIVMELFMEYAQELGLGTAIEIETMTGDAKSPYDFVKQSELELLAATQR